MWILLKLQPRPAAGSVHSAQRHRGPAATHLRISLWSIATSADAIISLKPSSEMGLPLGRTKRACGPADSLVISVSKSFAAKHPFLCKKGPGPVSRGRSGRCGRDETGPKHRQARARRVGDAGHRGAGQRSGCRRRLGGRMAVLFQHEFDHLQGAPGHDRALGVALGAGGAGGGCHLGSTGEVTRTGTFLAGGHHLPGKEERGGGVSQCHLAAAGCGEGWVRGGGGWRGVEGGPWALPPQATTKGRRRSGTRAVPVPPGSSGMR